MSFLPVMWFGFWLNFVSGVALLIGYPTKALTNPVFYLKLALIALGVWLVGRIRLRMDHGARRDSAITSLVCWAGAIISADVSSRTLCPSPHGWAGVAMANFQVWLVHSLRTPRHRSRRSCRRSGAGRWPRASTSLGLSMLVGCIGMFDLRLLGMAKRIPIAALHKLIPWGLFGFAINITTGSLFLLTEPDQYIYNPSFQFKVLFIAIAGANALTFYATSYGRATAENAPAEAPRTAKLIAVVSLSLWIGVIVCGRLLTFFRPGPCPASGPGLIADCTPRSR